VGKETKQDKSVAQTAVVAGSSGNGDDGDDDNGDDADDDGDNKLSFTVKDTGLSDSDGITNNNTITVDGLKEGETWQYSTDGGATFKLGTGRSFTLDDGAYVADTIQIEKLDAAAYRTRFCRNNRLLTIKIHNLRAIF
jgi:hypothetical protein